MKTSWVIDLDGVMWLGGSPIAGAAEAVNLLLEDGCSVVFVTNMSRLTIVQQQEKLVSCGVRGPVTLVTSAVAAASLLEAGSRALVCGGEGIAEAVAARDAEAVSAFSAECEDELEAFDAVLVGMDSRFDYFACGRAMRAVRAGARLIGTNHDPTFPTPDRLEAGGGALLAAVAAAAETNPEMAGKPHNPMRDCVIERFLEEGDTPGDLAGGGIVVGDRPDSDGLFAKVLGLPFALVMSGVTGAADLPVSPEPAYVESDLASLVGLLKSGC